MCEDESIHFLPACLIEQDISLLPLHWYLLIHHHRLPWFSGFKTRTELQDQPHWVSHSLSQSPICTWRIVGFLRLHNHVSQFLIINQSLSLTR